MRLVHVIGVLGAALALAGCARQAPRYAGVPMSQADLDMRMYGAPQPQAYAQPQRAYAGPPRAYGAQQPQSYVVRQAAHVVPVAAYDEGPYTLDSGDKLR